MSYYIANSAASFNDRLSFVGHTLCHIILLMVLQVFVTGYLW